MSREITDKTWGMQTRSFGIVWLTEHEANRAQAAYRSGAEFLEFNGLLVARGDIAGFAQGEMLRNVERKRQGEWECRYGYWHTKGQQCAHGELNRNG